MLPRILNNGVSGVKVHSLESTVLYIVVVSCGKITQLKGIGEYFLFNHVLPMARIQRSTGQLLHGLCNVQLEAIVECHHLQLFQAAGQLYILVYRDTRPLLILYLPLLVCPLNVLSPLLVFLFIPTIGINSIYKHIELHIIEHPVKGIHDLRCYRNIIKEYVYPPLSVSHPPKGRVCYLGYVTAR